MFSECRQLGFGLGLREKHEDQILAGQTRCDWFEIISENFMWTAERSSSRSLQKLEKIRSHYPVVMHGVAMSIGSASPLNFDYLHNLKNLLDWLQPEWVSDHLCWTGVHGQNSHDLLPLPYTFETVNTIADRIARVQDFLGRRILIENVSSYVEFQFSEMTEAEFVAEVVNKADCGLLLDLNNIYVSASNHGFDPLDYLKKIPSHRVGQFHLAGPSDRGSYLVDTHSTPVPDSVWRIYEQALILFGPVSTMIERDGEIPELSILEDELEIARSLAKNFQGTSTDRELSP